LDISCTIHYTLLLNVQQKLDTEKPFIYTHLLSKTKCAITSTVLSLATKCTGAHKTPTHATVKMQNIGLKVSQTYYAVTHPQQIKTEIACS